MHAFIKTQSNIAMEVISIFYMLILLVNLLLHKKRNHSNTILISMTLMEIILLMVQIGQWQFYYDSLSNQYQPYMDRLSEYLYCLDFSLIHFQVQIFIHYIISRATEIQPDLRKMYPWISRLQAILLLGGIALCSFYSSSLWTRNIFYVHSGITTYQLSTYNSVLNVNLLASICCLYIIWRFRKILGNTTVAIMLLYITSHDLILRFDLNHYTCFSYIFMSAELYFLYFGIDLRRSEQLQEQAMELALHRSELEEKNVQIMISQIQPHFLYNTLSVIDYLCGKNVELARTALNAFSEYLRMNMESINSMHPVSFSKELEHTKTYLWIEQMRFSDILKIEYDIQVSDFQIPPLTLQPLCENAVKHGVRGKEEGGTVWISTYQKDNKVFIVVKDDGIGFEVDQCYSDDRIHVGIENVKKRLAMISNGCLNIVSQPGIGTTATIILEEND